jgi:cytoskeletal protein CcmA (bactofilin family)
MSDPEHHLHPYKPVRRVRETWLSLIGRARIYAWHSRRAFLALFTFTLAAVALAAYASPENASASGRVLDYVNSSVQSQTAACTRGGRTVFGQNLAVAPAEWICGDVTVLGGNADIQGRVDGNLTVMGGNAVISSMVTGNVTVAGGNVELRPGAMVNGNVSDYGGAVRREPGTTITGNQTHEAVAPWSHVQWPVWSGPISTPWLRVVFWAFAAAVSAGFFPRTLTHVRSIAQRSWPAAFAMGILISLASVIAAVALVITCLGIPIALLLGLMLWVAWLFGTVAVTLWFGEMLLATTGTRRRSPLLPAMLGALFFALVQSVPFLGGLLAVVAGAIGIGSVGLAILHRGRRQSWHRAYR